MYSMAFMHRAVIRTICGLLAERSVVLVEGPPRCGRSTIARQVAAGSASGTRIVDARGREGRAAVADPGSLSAARPVILDNAGADEAAAILSWASAPGRRQEADRPGDAPDAPAATDSEDRASAMDSTDGAGKALENSGRRPRFVLVGGPFPGVPATCGYAAAVTAGPLSLFEVGRASVRSLWLRGGYPEAYGASSDDAALDWLERYAADLAHGALADWGMPREPRLITALLESVAAGNGHGFNENAAARALGVSRPTVSRYLSILSRAGILFSLPALPPGIARAPAERGAGVTGGVARAVRAPALYVRDSGLLHALLGVRSADELAMKPRMAAASWAGFVAAQAREAASPGTELYRYASADGAALDLVLVRDGVPVISAAARRLRPTSDRKSVV